MRDDLRGSYEELASYRGLSHCGRTAEGHLQHVFTAIAVNIERLSCPTPTGEATAARPPAAFQGFLDQHEIPRLKSWRAVST